MIRSKMRQTLTLVKGTIRLLQGVAAAATVFVLMAPDWRAFFLQDIPHRTLLTGLLSCVAWPACISEFEVHQLGSGGGVLSMDTYPLMVGFSLAFGVGLIVNATLSSFYELGRRWLRLLGRRRYRLHALGI
ncbi:MAG: hypothetical protein M0C28_30785 [Candidatus Moduliflexus flocculans]|nr:hypothetical protein [Candidatus Moduliflexus flocculans]